MAIVLAFAYVVLTDESLDLNDVSITTDGSNVAQDNVEDCNSKQAEVTKTEDKHGQTIVLKHPTNLLFHDYVL